MYVRFCNQRIQLPVNYKKMLLTLSETILFRVKESNVKFIVCEEEAIPVCKGVLAKSPIKFDIITTKQNKLGFPSLDQFLEEDDGSGIDSLSVKSIPEKHYDSKNNTIVTIIIQ